MNDSDQKDIQRRNEKKIYMYIICETGSSESDHPFFSVFIFFLFLVLTYVTIIKRMKHRSNVATGFSFHTSSYKMQSLEMVCQAIKKRNKKEKKKNLQATKVQRISLSSIFNCWTVRKVDCAALHLNYRRTQSRHIIACVTLRNS